ncbi:ArsR/SmtB family transcription factor [Halocalculus aciditolerans]|uniref:HTH arsR-type domain-containing protein n=1 Tax=Halocalculus aciditolerans TaxID=1383812 RepID=A0A830FEN5_9EURY|nr:winged helix-turn-helix domain-containing protein [Halocalculus aciditolerans]GGL67212.1 hypothetical protein GCM10009039_26540 [Halocalculus aciditolerans]
MEAPNETTPNTSDNPEDALPDPSVLSLDEYLSMQRSLGNRTRYEIVYYLRHDGPQTATDLGDLLGEPSSTIHYHLERLTDVGLVEERLRTTPDDTERYYGVTILATSLLSEGLETVLERE